MNKKKLVEIIVQMNKRKRNSYSLEKQRKEAGDDKQKLIDLIDDCRGKFKKGKGKNPQLKKLSVEELKRLSELIENDDRILDDLMFNQIKENKQGRMDTRFNDKKLKEVIMKCRGSPRKKQKGGSLKKRNRGWGFTY